MLTHQGDPRNSNPTPAVTARVCDLLATGFYSGRSPIMPGTCGSAVAAVLYWLVMQNSATGSWWIVALVISAVSIAVAEYAVRIALYGAEIKDPQQIVIDEFAGQAVAMIGLPWQPLPVFVAFVCFRFFDMTKLGPIGKAEELPGGWGIVMDDVIAGLAAAVVANCIVHFGGLS